MKSIVKTTLALSALLTLAGCDFGCGKKHEANEKHEAATHGQAHEEGKKCSHKGCDHKHHDEVKTRSFDADGNEIADENMDNMDVATQSMDENGNEIADENMDNMDEQA